MTEVVNADVIRNIYLLLLLSSRPIIWVSSMSRRRIRGREAIRQRHQLPQAVRHLQLLQQQAGRILTMQCRRRRNLLPSKGLYIHYVTF